MQPPSHYYHLALPGSLLARLPLLFLYSTTGIGLYPAVPEELDGTLSTTRFASVCATRVSGVCWGLANAPVQPCLYLAQSFIAPTGEVTLHKRKIHLTHVERYDYGDGGAESHQTSVKTEKGVVISRFNL